MLNKQATSDGPPLSQQAYEYVHSKLLDGALAPGSRVSENEIARELGVSRTPVREAIRRLRSEGVLYQVPRSGTFVAEVDRKQLADAYEVRIALEGVAAAKAARNMSAETLRELQDCCDRMRSAARRFRDSGEPILSGPLLHEFATADMQFHLVLLRAADNRLLFRTVAEVLMHRRAITFRGRENDLHLVARVWHFHARIARGIRRRDAKAARHWVIQHLRDSRRNVLAAFDRYQTLQTRQAASATDLSGVIEKLILGSSNSGVPASSSPEDSAGRLRHDAWHVHETQKPDAPKVRGAS